MTDAPPSPKRRRILSSMNPDCHHGSTTSPSLHQAPRSTPEPRSKTPRDGDGDGNDITEPQAAEHMESKPTTKFRFKSKSSRSSRHHHHHDASSHQDGPHGSGDTSSSSRRHGTRRHHHDRHRHKRRRHDLMPAADDEDTPGPDASGRLSPNSAFRESLFDAMADDEGAAYWEGVYGQPIHVYPRVGTTNAADGPERGDLERMTDDEYATYVRRKMWEKTHAGLMEEHARREEQKKRRERDDQERRRIADEMERSLRRGEERRRRRIWRRGWERYVSSWASWDGGVEGLPWPTRNGTREELAVEGEIRDFFEKGLDRDELGEKDFSARLKEERVRWHPDKVQQRLGGIVEENLMKDVTAIFQIIDKLWNDTRSKA